jgi:hypothetical protein
MNEVPTEQAGYPEVLQLHRRTEGRQCRQIAFGQVSCGMNGHGLSDTVNVSADSGNLVRRGSALGVSSWSLA